MPNTSVTTSFTLNILTQKENYNWLLTFVYLKVCKHFKIALKSKFYFYRYSLTNGKWIIPIINCALMIFNQLHAGYFCYKSDCLHYLATDFSMNA